MVLDKYKIFIFIILTTQLNIGFCGDLNISKNTRKHISSIFGDKPIIHDENIRYKINSFKSEQNLLVEGDQIFFQVAIRNKNEIPDLIGIFIDGNKNPLVATIKPGNSMKPQEKSITPSHGRVLFRIYGFADNYCGGKYNAVVVFKTNNELTARSIPFSTIVADCGLGNG